MPFREKRISSGEILEVEIYPITLQEYRKPRSRKNKESRKEQKQLNAKNSIKMFKRKVYSNFDKQSIFATLTYKYNLKSKIEKDVLKDFQNFLRRIKYKLTKEERENFKYIAVIESGAEGDNYHIHMVMDGVVNLLDIEKVWNKGMTTVSRLDDSPEGVDGLAAYISKEKRGSRRWLQSKNLKLPEVKVNDSKYRRKKQLDDLIRSVWDREEIERLYPGFEYISGQAERNLLYGGDYISLLMRRRC